MFDSTQVQSYNQIKAPAELRQRVMTACENQETSKAFSWQRATVSLAPIAACLLLLIGVLAYRQKDPLVLQIGNIPITSEYVTLTELAHPNNGSARARTVSLVHKTCTLSFTLNQQVQAHSVNGSVSVTEDGTLEWTVIVPDDDTLYELFLQTEEGTYYVPLQYHADNGSFTIRCEKQ